MRKKKSLRKIKEGDFFVFKRKNEVGRVGRGRKILELDRKGGKASVGKGKVLIGKEEGWRSGKDNMKKGKVIE